MKTLKSILLIILFELLGGCADSKFSHGMKKPLQLINNASSISDEAGSDVLFLYALGYYPNQQEDSSNLLIQLTCTNTNGPESVGRLLSTFGNGLEVVKEVGSPPEDTTYAGYVAQFRHLKQVNRDVSKAEVRKDVKDNLQKELFDEKKRCTELLSADLNSETVLGQKSVANNASLEETFGTILAIDGLVKEILGQTERIQRNAALRKVIFRLSSQFDDVAKELKAAPGAKFGLQVQYPENAKGMDLAKQGNSSTLGAVLTLRRWTLAQSLEQQWEGLKLCRSGGIKSAKNCLRDSEKANQALAFATSARKYAALAQVDPDSIRTAIDNAVEAAKDANKSDGISGLLDAVVELSSALSKLDAAYVKYDGTKE